MKPIVVDKSKRNAEKFKTSGEYSFDMIISFALLIISKKKATRFMGTSTQHNYEMKTKPYLHENIEKFKR
jgi:hypothetical protein